MQSNTPFYGVVDCSSYQPKWPQHPEPCQQTPFEAAFLFNGGGCPGEDPEGKVLFTCKDSPFESLLNKQGALAYLVVEDGFGKGFVYFEGWTEVGSLFYIASP